MPLAHRADRCAGGKATTVALAPAVAIYSHENFGWTPPFLEAANPPSDWLVEALKGRKVAAVIQSFLLDRVVREANVILNTSDLSRVQLNRHGAKMVFDLTANPPPEVWLREGDVIEIPERDEGAPVTGAK